MCHYTVAGLLPAPPRENGGEDGEGGEENGKEGEEEEEELADPDQVLDRILDGVCRPFKVRVEQVLAASPGVLAAFKLANLLSFYRNTLAHIVGADAALVLAVEECRAAAQASFDDQVHSRGERLRRSPPAPNDALTPPPAVAEGVQRVIELLEVGPGRYCSPRHPTHFKPWYLELNGIL